MYCETDLIFFVPLPVVVKIHRGILIIQSKQGKGERALVKSIVDGEEGKYLPQTTSVPQRGRGMPQREKQVLLACAW